MKRLSFKITFLFLVCTAILHPSAAQKKNFTYDQIFKSAPSYVTKLLPQITGKADDEHFLELRYDSAAKIEKMLAVNVKTGKATSHNRGVVASPSIASLGLNNNEKNITLSPDNKWVAYTRNNNLFALELQTKKEIQFTTDGSDTILNGYASWVYYEEILGRSTNYKAFWWSPDSKHLVYMRFDDSDVPLFPIYVADGQHGYLEQARFPKAGDKNPDVQMGIASLATRTTVWADFNASDDQYFGMPLWSPTGELLLQWMNRGQDILKIYSIDLVSGGKKKLYEEKQSTWIDLDDPDRIEFLPSGNGFVLKSDKDGWENLYYHDSKGKLVNQVTTGNFWGTKVSKINEKEKTIYFRARRENSARFDFYKIGLNGKGLTRLSFGEFSHDKILPSPTGKYFITTYSNVSSPPAMALVNAKGKLVRELGNSIGPEFESYNLPRTEVVKVKSTDGLFELPVLITYPVNFDSTKRYPVLVDIYGGPNAGKVYDRWKPLSGPAQWWAQEGIIQVAIDNRSSGHFGKKGLNFVYRNLGKWEIEDYIAAGQWLRSKAWTDTTKIAITGGSFGGYLTCLALTYGAGTYTHGIANAPVTDWRLYDTHYTERYMDTPNENPEGYKAWAVNSYVNMYKGLLRIVHGTSDDNVHMQNSIQLVDALQKLNKHFEFMLYPGERHSIGANDAAKSRHLKMEAYRFYYKNLLEKPFPAEFETSPASKGF